MATVHSVKIPSTAKMSTNSTNGHVSIARLEDKMLSSSQSEDHVDGRWVKIPDLFTSIMSKEPVVNELYMASKEASDDWLRG